MSDYSTTTPNTDNQCVLKHEHTGDHILSTEIGEHKCTGKLDCCFCKGYYLSEFDRCGARKVLIETWLDATNTERVFK